MDKQHSALTSKPLRLECRGCIVGDHWLPPFQLHAGEAACLHVEPSSVPWYDTLLPVFKGEMPADGLRLHGSIDYLERPMPRRGWFGRIEDYSARDWLMDQRKLSSSEAMAVLERMGVPPDLRVGWMGWNERTLLALEALLRRPPDLLVFDAVGNDAIGTCRLFDRLASRPNDLALLYLKGAQDRDGPCVPRGMCFEIPTRIAETTLVE